MTETDTNTAKNNRPSTVSLGIIWARGALYIVVIYILWYFVSPLISSLCEGMDTWNEYIATGITVIFGPLIAGWLGSKFIRPLLQRWDRIVGFFTWEERIARAFAPDNNMGFRVVLVPSPSEEVKTLGLLSSTHTLSNGDRELASVYLPGTPHPSKGTMRIVPVDKLVYTEWTLKDLLHHQASFGTTGPDYFSRSQIS